MMHAVRPVDITYGSARVPSYAGCLIVDTKQNFSLWYIVAVIFVMVAGQRALGCGAESRGLTPLR